MNILHFHLVNTWTNANQHESFHSQVVSVNMRQLGNFIISKTQLHLIEILGQGLYICCNFLQQLPMKIKGKICMYMYGCMYRDVAHYAWCIYSSPGNNVFMDCSLLYAFIVLLGEFGIVYRGLLLPESKNDIPKAVAVKTLKGIMYK